MQRHFLDLGGPYVAFYLETGTDVRNRFTSVFSCNVGRAYPVPSQHSMRSVQERDDNWFRLASGLLNASKSLLRDTFAHDDTILLANAIFIIRRTIQTFSAAQQDHQRDIIHASSKALEILCRFDIQNTLPEHQHQFCSLWNQLVDAAQNNTHPHVTSLCKMMLKNLRRLYITLHKGTNSSQRHFLLLLRMVTEIWMMLCHIPGAKLSDIIHPYQYPNCK